MFILNKMSQLPSGDFSLEIVLVSKKQEVVRKLQIQILSRNRGSTKTLIYNYTSTGCLSQQPCSKHDFKTEQQTPCPISSQFCSMQVTA